MQFTDKNKIQLIIQGDRQKAELLYSIIVDINKSNTVK